MSRLNRVMHNIFVENLSQSLHFYTKLFHLEVEYESDWFVQLVSQSPYLELGLILRTHASIPKSFQKSPSGSSITFVVQNVEEVFETAKEEGFVVIQEPRDTEYGQRQLLLQEPSGQLVDVSSPIHNFKMNG